jgi:hypothetical protein
MDTVDSAIETAESYAQPVAEQHLLEDLSLSNFLSRPVIMNTYPWTEGSYLNLTKFDPFKLLIAIPAIKSKLTGYHYLRAGLEITISIAATPFLYGALHAAYIPLDDCNGGANTYAPSVMPDVSNINSIVQRSTAAASGWLFPQDGTTLTLVVPFIYPTEWYDLVDPPTMMGSLALMSATTLRSAGTAAVSVANVTVSARFITPEVSGLTSLPVQSGTLSGASKDLARYGFSTASSWAKIASHAAKIVGLSNDGKEPLATPVLAKPLYALTSSEVSVPVEALSMGPDVSLASDPTPDDDELNVASIVAKESYVNVMSWNTTAIVGTSIQTILVTPSMFSFTLLSGALARPYYNVHMTPSCYIGTMFNFWRGTMCYRFKVSCSQFHRGKLRFFYDTGKLSAVPAEALLPSVVLDLATSTEVVIRVPMNTITPWAKTCPVFNGQFGVSTLVPPYSPTVPVVLYDTPFHQYFNGTIRVDVLQPLTSPDDISAVNILMSSWLEDGQFADPLSATSSTVGRIALMSPATWQGGQVVPYNPTPPEPPISQPELDVLPPQSGNVSSGQASLSVDGNCTWTKGRALETYIGEDIISLRALMHRATFYRSVQLRGDQSVTNVVAPAFVQTIMPRAPRYYGIEPDSALFPIADYANVSAVDIPFNFCVDTPFTRLSAMFQGYKGSVRWRAMTSATQNLLYPAALAISRTHYSPSRSIYLPSSFSSSSSNALIRVSAKSDTVSGSAVTNLNHNALTVDMPDYSLLKFQPSNLTITAAAAKPFTQIDWGDDNMALTTTLHPTGSADQNRNTTAVDLYFAACPNMKLLHYKCIPSVYHLTPAVAPPPSTTK